MTAKKRKKAVLTREVRGDLDEIADEIARRISHAAIEERMDLIASQLARRIDAAVEQCVDRVTASGMTVYASMRRIEEQVGRIEQQTRRSEEQPVEALPDCPFCGAPEVSAVEDQAVREYECGNCGAAWSSDRFEKAAP